MHVRMGMCVHGCALTCVCVCARAHVCERERVPFDKMTARIKPIVLRKFDVPYHKTSTSRLILLKDYKLE